MKTLLMITFAMLIALSGHSQNEKELKNKNFHDFIVEDIDGNTFDLSNLKGKKVLVVNTASECGYTPQYEGLQELYEKYGDESFTVIGFPANNFGNQEPGSDGEIKAFCKKNFGVTFPMMSKISVKGADKHPLYLWLTNARYNDRIDSEIKWNFQKYLINENGELVDMLYSKTKPMDKKILSWIEDE
ncbi:MAG: glutathione peroxidase [Bacteroidota bacterium]